MKTKLFFVTLLIVLSVACSTQNIVVEEITLTEPKQFTKFKEEQIKVTLKDTVHVSMYNEIQKKYYHKKGIMNNQPIEKYRFTKDSLFIDNPYFHSVVGLKAVSQVKFKGIWDTEAGFISEEEINKNKYNRNGWLTFGSGLAGLVVGGGLGSFAGYGFSLLLLRPRMNLDEAFTTIGVGIILGAALGSVLGIAAFTGLISPSYYTMDERIEIIRKERQKK